MVARLRGERAPAAQPLRLRVDELPGQLRDEGRHVAELTEPPEPLQRRQLVVAEAFLHGCDGQIPGVQLNRCRQLFDGLCGSPNAHGYTLNRRADGKT